MKLNTASWRAYLNTIIRGVGAKALEKNIGLGIGGQKSGGSFRCTVEKDQKASPGRAHLPTENDGDPVISKYLKSGN